MNLVFKDKALTIDMEDYLHKAIKEFPEDCTKKITAPAVAFLINKNPNQEKLSDKQRTIFHWLVAKRLFVSKRGRPDIQVAIAFLTTRVTSPDKDDWGKLRRLMYYINSNI